MLSTIIQIVVTIVIVLILYFAISFVTIFFKKRKIFLQSVYQSLSEYLEKELEKFKSKEGEYLSEFPERLYQTYLNHKNKYLKMSRKAFFQTDIKSFKDRQEVIIALLIKIPQKYFMKNATEILKLIENIKIK